MTKRTRGGILKEHEHFLPGSAQMAGTRGQASAHNVPLRGLLISFLALAVALLAGTVFRGAVDDTGDLLWSLAIVPALLLAYHRGWRKVALALTLGLAVLWFAYIVGFTLSLPISEWPALLPVVSAYIAIALASGWISEVQANVIELRAKERELQEAYVVLQASHEAHKAAQMQLIHAEKLESVGLLAAGVAHEVKNPLMTLLTGVHYLREFAPAEDEDVKQLLADMWLAVRRADSVIKGLLDYSRARELLLKEEDVNDLVERTLKFVKHECDKKRIHVKRDLADGLPTVTMDSYKIQQVLVNVFTNAVYAMPPGGSLTIRTAARDGEGADARTEEETPGARPEGPPSKIVIEVQDTGPGIPEESLAKIFDPFFTTKPTGEGTGLGLAVSRQIMEMHGGGLDINNNDQGVCATLTLKPKFEEA